MMANNYDGKSDGLLIIQLPNYTTPIHPSNNVSPVQIHHQTAPTGAHGTGPLGDYASLLYRHRPVNLEPIILLVIQLKLSIKIIYITEI